MTDGVYIPIHNTSTAAPCEDPECNCKYLAPRIIVNDSPASSIPADAVNTTTFAGWIALEPVSTPVALLYAIAIDLGRRGWGGCAFEVRRQADDLEMLTRNAP